ncbi:MAG: zinc ribbon domain-containing protein [Lachnospiraceae bacterium]|nr:zinc ribbon domain-containing protein [Lachnospiraceae bacterium]
MFCSYCGNEINDGVSFCSYCGAKLAARNGMRPGAGGAVPPVQNGGVSGQEAASDPYRGQQGTFVTPNILLCADGKYRWMYEMSMFKNPTIFLTVCKVFAISLGILFVPFTIMSITSGDGLEGFLGQMKVLGIVAAVIIGLILISYPIAVLMLGGKYIVFFEMDEKGVVHIQAPKQFSKSQAIGVMGMLAGALSGNLSTFALGMHVSAVNSRSSTWEAVKSVKSSRGMNVIYVNELLFKNQVYAEKEDFAFVENYIKSHCTHAKIR